MSAHNFYLEHGYTPQYRYQRWDATSTLAIWTPTTDTKPVITGITITNNGAAGTFLIVFNNTTADKIAQFTVGASATITPAIQAIQGTAANIQIMGRPAVGGTDTWHVHAAGFEMP